MRGQDLHQTAMYSYINPEQRVPADHRLRPLRTMVNEALAGLSNDFDALYKQRGRPSIPPEHLLRALLLQMLYGVRSERQLIEQIEFNILFRWFIGLEMDAPVWDATVFVKNRERLMEGDISQKLLQAILDKARAHNLLSEEHFTVDGTLLEAWANRRSFEEKDPSTVVGTGSGGSKLLRDTHESTTDPEARLYKKSTAAQAEPSYLGHVLMENRNGFAVASHVTQSSSTAEREAALEMLAEIQRSEPAITLGADKQYQDPSFVEQLRERKVVPHIAEYESGKNGWKNSLLPEERDSPGFQISQRKRKRVEMIFGWGKLSSLMRQMKLRGRAKVDWFFCMLIVTHDLVRLANLIPAL